MEGELQLNICSLSLHTGQMATVQVARLGRGNTDVGFGVVQPFFCFSTKKKQVLLKPQMSRMWYRSSHLTNGKGKKIRIVFRLSCHFPIFNICCNYLKDGKRKTLLMTVIKSSHDIIFKRMKDPFLIIQIHKCHTNFYIVIFIMR